MLIGAWYVERLFKCPVPRCEAALLTNHNLELTDANGFEGQRLDLRSRKGPSAK